ncbi:MAG TPA: hypothetical protein VF181_10305 [Balneolaceae bacterium]
MQKILFFIGLAGILFLSGCSVINFGIGAALEGPRKTVLKEEFHPNYMPPDHSLRYSTKVFTGLSVTEAGACDGFFIKEKQTGSLYHMAPDNVTIYKKDGSSLNGVIKYFGKNKSGLFLRFDSKSVPFNEIEKIQFHTMDADILRLEDGSYMLYPGTDSKRKTLHHSEIEALYLGFNVYSKDNPSYFVEVDQVEKIIYKRDMSILPYALAGVGLVIDTVAVILILIL